MLPILNRIALYLLSGTVSVIVVLSIMAYSYRGDILELTEDIATMEANKAIYEANVKTYEDTIDMQNQAVHDLKVDHDREVENFRMSTVTKDKLDFITRNISKDRSDCENISIILDGLVDSDI